MLRSWAVRSGCLFVLAFTSSSVAKYQAQQHPMDSSKVTTTQHLSLADLLGRNQRIQIFSGLIRDVDSVSQRLADESQQSIVLTPENVAMSKMSQKPWESTEDYN